jgi:lysosomal alpha-mannosidase
MEAGWKETAERYYRDSAKPIFTSVVEYLSLNPGKTFTHAEIWFFKRWWMDQDILTQQKVKKLVKEGRFEFVNGGWVESDEATTTYEQLIENFALGKRWLHDTFDISPKIGW